MPSPNPSQRIAEISKELEILLTQSLSHSEKASEMLQDGLKQIQVSLEELTALAGGGHDMGILENKGERKWIVKKQSLAEIHLSGSVPKRM